MILVVCLFLFLCLAACLFLQVIVYCSREIMSVIALVRVYTYMELSVFMLFLPFLISDTIDHRKEAHQGAPSSPGRTAPPPCPGAAGGPTENGNNISTYIGTVAVAKELEAIARGSISDLQMLTRQMQRQHQD